MLPFVFLSLLGLALADLDHSKFEFSLRDYAYATILLFLGCKNNNFRMNL